MVKSFRSFFVPSLSKLVVYFCLFQVFWSGFKLVSSRFPLSVGSTIGEPCGFNLMRIVSQSIKVSPDSHLSHNRATRSCSLYLNNKKSTWFRLILILAIVENDFYHFNNPQSVDGLDSSHYPTVFHRTATTNRKRI